MCSTTITLSSMLFIATAYLAACKAESESSSTVSEADVSSSSGDLGASHDPLEEKAIEHTQGSGNVDTIRVPTVQLGDAWASYDFDGDYRLEFAMPDSGQGADLYRYVVPGTGSITVEGLRQASGVPAAVTALRVASESDPGTALRIVLDEQGIPARLELTADGLSETIELESHLRNGTSSTWRGRESTLAHDRRLHSDQHAAPNSPVITQASWQAEASPRQDNRSKIRHGVDTISVLVRPVGCDDQVLRDDSVAMATLRIRTPKGFPTELFQPHAFNEQMQEALNRAQAGISMPIDILSGDVLATVPMVYVPEYDAFQATVSIGWFDQRYADMQWFADNHCDLFAEAFADLDDFMVIGIIESVLCVGIAPYGVPPALAQALVDRGRLNPKDLLRLTIALEVLISATCITRNTIGNDDYRRRRKTLESFIHFCSSRIVKQTTASKFIHLRPLLSAERIPDLHTLDVFIQLADDCRTGGLRSARVGPFDVTKEHVIASSAEGERLTRLLRTPVLIAEACLNPYEDPIHVGSFACIPSESVSSNQQRTPPRHDNVPFEPTTWSYSNSWIENDEFDHAVTGNITPLLQGEDGQGVQYQLRHTASLLANLPGHPQRGGFLDVPVDPKPTVDPERVTRDIRSTFQHQTTDWITIYPGQSLHVEFHIQTPNATGAARVSHNSYLEISWIEHASISSRRDKVFRLDAMASLHGDPRTGDSMRWKWQMGSDRQTPPGERGAAEYDQRKFVELSYDDILVALGIQARQEQLEKDFKAKLESVNMKIESRDQVSAILQMLDSSHSPQNSMSSQLDALLQSPSLDSMFDHMRGQLLSEPAMQDCIRLRVVRGVNTSASIQVKRPRIDEPVNTSIQGRALFKVKVEAR